MYTGRSAGSGSHEPMDYTAGTAPPGTLDSLAPGEDLEGLSLDSHILNARPKARYSEEEKLAAVMMKKRQVDMERRQRIFDAKRRSIGLDVEALDAQKAENQERRLRKIAEERASDREMLRYNAALKMVEKERGEERRKRETHCKEYSMQNLHFESRKEFDINDPKVVRKGVPARVGDNDPRCGPASMQRFAGEDLMGDERKKHMQLEMRHFLEQQKFEKAILNADTGEMKAYAKEMEELGHLRGEMEDEEKLLRGDLQKSHQSNILDQAAADAERRNRETELEMERNDKELDFHSKDHFLQETAPHMMPSGRIIRDAFKGSTREEREMVAQRLQDQAGKQDMLRQQERFEDHMFAKQTEQTRKQMLTMEREKSRMKRAMAEQMARENQAAAVSQKDKLKKLDQLYTNEYRPEFFEQFGVGAR